MKATFDDVTELVAYFHMSHLVKKRNDPIWWLGTCDTFACSSLIIDIDVVKLI